MSRRERRRANKARRQTSSWPFPSAAPVEPPAAAAPRRVVVREARQVERLAYTRSQAAQALGVSQSTFRRLIPYLETIEMPWGAKLIPVDELERLVAERRRAAEQLPRAPRGRRPTLAPALVARIRAEFTEGKSLREIARRLNAAGIETARGGRQWWPSTVRAVLVRSARLESAEVAISAACDPSAVGASSHVSCDLTGRGRID